jgi:glutathione synthase/RimK-type ligase-like ATP-grasp enzyme
MKEVNINPFLQAEFDSYRPLVGILTSRKKNGVIAGNGPLFMNLQKRLISLAGISFIFTLEDVFEDGINGYTFLPNSHRWVKVKAPLPDLVYNRLPFRKAEQTKSYQLVKDMLASKKIPFFNPCFIDKYECYRLLNHHPTLGNHLPETILIKEKHTLQQFLHNHNSVYLKPAQASKGKGILLIKVEEDGKIQLRGIDIEESHPSFEHFWEKWERTFLDKKYLAQEEIHSVRYKGSRFDFRILAHATMEGYTVTGIGIRQSQKQEITTHIPAGGKLLPYSLFQSETRDQFIQQVVNETGKALSEKLGFFGEFSIDLGFSTNGNYYIYEVNSKPMSFDEPEIEERKIEQLCRLFLQLTGYQ